MGLNLIMVNWTGSLFKIGNKFKSSFIILWNLFTWICNITGSCLMTLLCLSGLMYYTKTSAGHDNRQILFWWSLFFSPLWFYSVVLICKVIILKPYVHKDADVYTQEFRHTITQWFKSLHPPMGSSIAEAINNHRRLLGVVAVSLIDVTTFIT